MKTSKRVSLPLSFLLAFILLLPCAPAKAATSLLSYNFNEGLGTEAFSAGSLTTGYSLNSYNSSNALTNLYTASGTGVSGLAGDYAFNTGATTMSGTGGYMKLQTASVLDDLKSFTLTGWFNAENTFGGASRIISNTTGLNGFLLMTTGNGIIQLQINGAVVATSTNIYSGLNQWIYFAVSYDSIAGNVTFYKGATSGTLTSQSYSVTSGIAMVDTGAGGYVYVGNRPGADRAFDGSLDNIGIYASSTDASGVLTSSEIDAIRLSAIPEAEVSFLLSIGFLLISIPFLKRDRKSLASA